MRPPPVPRPGRRPPGPARQRRELRSLVAAAGFATVGDVDAVETDLVVAEESIEDIETDLGSYQPIAEKGQANGYAELDGTGKVPAAQIPAGGGVPDATTSAKGIVELATDGENAANVVVQGNDARLSNARTPTAHASTHRGGGADGFYTLVATLAANQATGANTTPVTLTGLVFNFEANSKYRIWFMGRIQAAAATTGCGFQCDLSNATGCTIDMQFSHQLANTGTQTGGHSLADDASVAVSSGVPSTSAVVVSGEALLVTGANTGTAQLRFRSETNAVITALAGLTLVVEKIA